VAKMQKASVVLAYIRTSVKDQDSVSSVDPDVESRSVSGSKKQKGKNSPPIKKTKEDLFVLKS
jgi:hypothetical protein